jgi:hypothetical protein
MTPNETCAVVQKMCVVDDDADRKLLNAVRVMGNIPSILFIHIHLCAASARLDVFASVYCPCVTSYV